MSAAAISEMNRRMRTASLSQLRRQVRMLAGAFVRRSLHGRLLHPLAHPLDDLARVHRLTEEVRRADVRQGVEHLDGGVAAQHDDRHAGAEELAQLLRDDKTA